jgi:hypothetical protein
MAGFRLRAALAAALALAAPYPGVATAAEVAFGAVGSTLGVGGEVGYGLGRFLAVRTGAYAYNYTADSAHGGIEYDAQLDLASAGAYLDWHPFAGTFRLSAGWLFNNNELTGTGRPGADGNYAIGDASFTPAQVGKLTSTGEFRSSAPFLGVGWRFGGRDGRGVALSLDAGVVFQGVLDMRLQSRGGSLSEDPDFRAALAAEEAELQAEVAGYDLFPVVTLGLGYRF